MQPFPRCLDTEIVAEVKLMGCGTNLVSQIIAFLVDSASSPRYVSEIEAEQLVWLVEIGRYDALEDMSR